jgi:hypothetical protein
MDSEDTTCYVSDLRQTITEQDLLRSQSFQAVFPELTALVDA